MNFEKPPIKKINKDQVEEGEKTFLEKVRGISNHKWIKALVFTTVLSFSSLDILGGNPDEDPKKDSKKKSEKEQTSTTEEEKEGKDIPKLIFTESGDSALVKRDSSLLSGGKAEEIKIETEELRDLTEKEKEEIEDDPFPFHPDVKGAKSSYPIKFNLPSWNIGEKVNKSISQISSNVENRISSARYSKNKFFSAGVEIGALYSSDKKDGGPSLNLTLKTNPQRKKDNFRPFVSLGFDAYISGYSPATFKSGFGIEFGHDKLPGFSLAPSMVFAKDVKRFSDWNKIELNKRLGIKTSYKDYYLKFEKGISSNNYLISVGASFDSGRGTKKGYRNPFKRMFY